MYWTDVSHAWSADTNVKPYLMFCHICFHLQFYEKQIIIFYVFQVVLSVFWRKGMFGAAYYTAETSEVRRSVPFFLT
jgi:hypothetical protein